MVLDAGSHVDEPAKHRVTIMSEPSIDLSVVVPVYNGETFIERTMIELVDFLSSLDEPSELIVVDDGSSDQTAELISGVISESSASVQFIESPRNEGKGAAIRRGMAVAKGRYRVFLDADLAYSPDSVSEVRSKLAEGAEVVIGSRVHPDSTYQVRPSFFRYLYTRHVAGRVFNWIVRLSLLPGIYDSQAGLKGFTAGAADTIFGGWLPDGFSFDLGVLLRARHERLVIEQIPVRYRYDSEPTTVRFVSDSLSAVYDLAVVRLRIGGEYSRKGFGRWTSWSGLQLERLHDAARSPKAISVGAGAIVFAMFAHVFFRTTLPSNLMAMLAWLIACSGLVLVSARIDARLPTENRPVFENFAELACFLSIFALAAILRFWNLSHLPAMVHGDSAECGIQGLAILLGRADDVFGFSSWYFTPYPAYLPYAASFAIAGTTVLGLRLPSAVLGTLCVIPLYFLVRGWLGRRPAQIASVLFALSHAAVHFSRIGLWNIQALFFELVAFALLAAALRKGSAVLATLAGIAGGLGFFTYTGGRLIVIVAASVFALQLLFGPRRRLAQVIGFTAAGVAVAISPLVVNYLKNPAALTVDRTGEVLAFAEVNRHHVEAYTGKTTTLGILQVQTIETLKGFFAQGGRSGQYGGTRALASPLSATLALAGFLIAIARFRDPARRIVLMWTGLGLLLGSILIIDPPSHTRLIVLFPIPFIFAALALEWVFRRIEGRRTPGGRFLIAAVTVVVIGQAALFNIGGYSSYAERVREQSRIWDVVKVVERYGRDYDYYFFGGQTMSAQAPAIRLFAGRHRIVNGVTSVDIPTDLSRDSIIIVPPVILNLEPHMRNIGTYITENFPNARRRTVGKEDDPQLMLYIVSSSRPPRIPGGRHVRKQK
jgi:glycosyltransferase involved in cell wall biosynthesis